MARSCWTVAGRQRFLPIILTACFLCRTAAGMYPPRISASYDLDSLVFLADQVIEARLVRGPYPAGGGNQADFCVEDVYAGTLRPGQLIALERIGSLVKPGGAYTGWSKALEPADRCVLFLNRQQAVQHDPSDPPVFSPVLNGVKMVVRGKVVDSLPWDYWQPFPTLGSSSRGQPIAEIARLVRQRVPRLANLRARLTARAAKGDIPWLLSILKQRAAAGFTNYWNNDAIANAVGERLAQLHDLPTLEQGMLIDPNPLWPRRGIFETPEGRDYLLRRVVDTTLPVDHRQWLVRILINSGGVYRSSFAQAATRPWQSPSDADPMNSSYFTRIARAAGEVGEQSPDLAAGILEVIEQNVFEPPDRDPQIQVDLDSAVAVLQTIFHRVQTPGVLRYAIERACLRIGGGAFEKLGSRSGPILLLARAEDTTHYVTPPVPSLLVRYEFVALPGAESVTTTSAVLEPIGKGKTYVIPGALRAFPKVSPGSGGGSVDWFTLPADLKPGRYRVHYRLMNGTQIVGEGHSFETTLSLSRPSAPARLVAPAPSFNIPYKWIRGGLIVAALIPVLLAVRRVVRQRIRLRRFFRGLCTACGYDLRASREVCPECGTRIPFEFVTGVLRRRMFIGACVACGLLCLFTLAMWARGYLAADCITRTTYGRADSVYFTRGVIGFELFTVPGQLGWQYDRAEPRDFARSAAETGVSPDWRVLGIEYAPAAGLIIVPLWAVGGATAASTAIGFQRLRRTRDKTKLPR